MMKSLAGKLSRKRHRLVAVALILSCCAGAPAGAAVKDLAKHIVRSSGIDVGLCVHLGCKDGKLISELAKQGKFLAHGLAANGEDVKPARSYIASQDLNGRVSVEHSSLSRLPYVDNLVNLIVVDDLPGALKNGLSLEEMMRVLCPNGVAYLGGMPKQNGLKAELTKAGIKGFEIVENNGIWAKVRKERPKEMDEWTHWLHGPEGNNHSSDSLAGPSARLQWIDGPVWMKGGNITELFANGRGFNLLRGGTRKLPETLLIARDAYNGLVLWKRNTATNDPHLLVAIGERVFTVMKQGGSLVALDAATGEVVKAYDVGASPLVVFCIDGHLMIGTEKALFSINVETAKIRWKKTAPGNAAFVLKPSGPLPVVLYKPPYMVSSNGRLFVFLKDAPKPPYTLMGYDLVTGEEKWREKHPGELLAYYKEVLILYEALSTTKPSRKGNTEEGIYHVVSAKDGKKLWDHHNKREGYHGVWDDPCYAGGLFWLRNQSFDITTGKEGKTLKRHSGVGHCARTITTLFPLRPAKGLGAGSTRMDVMSARFRRTGWSTPFR